MQSRWHDLEDLLGKECRYGDPVVPDPVVTNRHVGRELLPGRWSSRVACASHGWVVACGSHGDHGAFLANLSRIVKEFTDGSLHKGYIVHQIMKKHLKFIRNWEADGKEITRYLLITPKNILNIVYKLAKETYMLHPNDTQSVRMWVQKNPNKIFHYTETNLASPIQVDGQLNGENMPFTIGK